MSKRLAVLAATTALVGLSSPALAQQGWVDDSYDAVAETAMRAGHSWDDEPQAGVSWNSDAASAYEAAEEDYGYGYESREVVQDIYQNGAVETGRSSHGSRDHHRSGHHGAAAAAPRLAYGAEERAEWLSQCRALHARPEYDGYDDDYDDEDDSDGGLIGGLIGAVTGGFAGNRIANGNRLLGTAIGAGIGGLAGVVIGSVIDGQDDDDDRRPVYNGDDGYAFDYCEAYLLNYERGYGVPGQAAYAPVVMVPVAQQGYGQTVQSRRSYRVIEEDVVVETAETHAPPRGMRRAMPPREHGKLVRTN